MTVWTDEAVSALERYYGERRTDGEIAHLLWAHHGVKFTRFELGAQRRCMGLAARREDRAAEPHPWRGHIKIRGGPKIAVSPPPDIAPAPHEFRDAKGILDLAKDDCRWPLEPTMADASHKTLYCGRAAVDGPYCARHAEKARPA